MVFAFVTEYLRTFIYFAFKMEKGKKQKRNANKIVLFLDQCASVRTLIMESLMQLISGIASDFPPSADVLFRSFILSTN